ncbi:MAG TPA: hypothetical protein VFF73_03745 [Planctomycetota bacterium]|nr:hypothetical protein [Planctomycetota bacterium]
MDCDLAVRIESRRALSLYEEATLDLQRGFDGGDREHLLRALASCDEALGVLSRLPASPQTECALSSDVPRLEDLVRSLKTLCGKALAERG